MYCACVVSFVVVQIKYNAKCSELFKIRPYIKCPLLLLLLFDGAIRITNAMEMAERDTVSFGGGTKEISVNTNQPIKSRI